MSILSRFAAIRVALLALIAALSVAACGSSSGPENDSMPVGNVPGGTVTTGTVGILFTDAPTDEYSAIKLYVVGAILIGEDESQEILFEGSEPIDLLDLTNFSEPIVFGEVKVGTYTKLRLIVDRLELVPMDGGESIYPHLPGNGKIDLLQSEGFNVLPGRTLMMMVDMDANKSIKTTNAGNSGKVNFRPVVKVKIIDGGSLHKLARLEGSVSGTPGDPAGGFVLCDIDSPDYCVDVRTDGTTSVFDDEGLGTDFSTLNDGDMVIVIGRYETDPEIIMMALVLEIGGTAEQIKGSVVSSPTDSSFLLVADDGSDLVIELQPGTKYFDAAGEIGADAIVLGVDIEVEGVKLPKADDADPNVMRAALVFLEAEEDEQVSGIIIEPIDPDDRSFGLRNDTGDSCVVVRPEAAILFVDVDNSEVTMGTFDKLEVDQSVDVFGMMPETGCFDANEVIVNVPSAT